MTSRRAHIRPDEKRAEAQRSLALASTHRRPKCTNHTCHFPASASWHLEEASAECLRRCRVSLPREEQTRLCQHDGKYQTMQRGVGSFEIRLELTCTHRQGATRRMLSRTACGALPVRVRIERPVRPHGSLLPITVAGNSHQSVRRHLRWPLRLVPDRKTSLQGPLRLVVQCLHQMRCGPLRRLALRGGALVSSKEAKFAHGEPQNLILVRCAGHGCLCGLA